MKKILVPTDFSDCAMKALIYAAGIAHKTGATIYLLHSTANANNTILEPLSLDNNFQEEFVNTKLDELDSLQDAVAEIYPAVKVDTELSKDLLNVALDDQGSGQQADLIVMGTTGARGIKEVFTGSTTAEIISTAKIPVLTVPADYQMGSVHAIMFATNHFEENKDLLSYIVELATVYTAVIHVVVFVQKNKADAAEYLYNSRQMARYLDFLHHSFPGNTFKGELLDGSDFERTLNTYNEENKVDLIAIIKHPKSFWDKWLVKNHTRQMALHSNIPLLVIPSKQHAALVQKNGGMLT